MDKEQTKKAIKVMQAAVDGEIVQVKFSHNWSDRSCEMVGLRPVWDWTYEYRIKPKLPLIGHFWPSSLEIKSFKGIELTPEVIEALEKAGISYAD